jgi:hypothetical protein
VKAFGPKVASAANTDLFLNKEWLTESVELGSVNIHENHGRRQLTASKGATARRNSRLMAGKLFSSPTVPEVMIYVCNSGWLQSA